MVGRPKRKFKSWSSTRKTHVEAKDVDVKGEASSCVEK